MGLILFPIVNELHSKLPYFVAECKSFWGLKPKIDLNTKFVNQFQERIFMFTDSFNMISYKNNIRNVI